MGIEQLKLPCDDWVFDQEISPAVRAASTQKSIDAFLARWKQQLVAAQAEDRQKMRAAAIKMQKNNPSKVIRLDQYDLRCKGGAWAEMHLGNDLQRLIASFIHWRGHDSDINQNLHPSFAGRQLTCEAAMMMAMSSSLTGRPADENDVRRDLERCLLMTYLEEPRDYPPFVKALHECDFELDGERLTASQRDQIITACISYNYTSILTLGKEPGRPSYYRDGPDRTQVIARNPDAPWIQHLFGREEKFARDLEFREVYPTFYEWRQDGRTNYLRGSERVSIAEAEYELTR